MKIYFLCAGILGILYYLILAFYSKRWNSTFTGFWLAAGGAHVLLGCVPLSFDMKKVFIILLLFGWGTFFLVESFILRAMRNSYKGHAAYLIVLGAQVRGRKITDSLLRRLDAAIPYLLQHMETTVIVSGGQGPGEDITEAEAMAEYLETQGISRERIIKEEKSTSTRENLRYSRQFLKSPEEPVCIVTNDFHLYRALITGSQEGYKNLSGIAATSNPIFQLNYLVREFFAVLALWTFGKCS